MFSSQSGPQVAATSFSSLILLQNLTLIYNTEYLVSPRSVVPSYMWDIAPQYAKFKNGYVTPHF